MKDLFPRELLDSLGVLDWGYTEESIPRSFARMEEWVKTRDLGPLTYLSDYRFSFRDDIRRLYPEFQSALVFLFSYQPTKKWMLENNRHEVAAYTLGFEGEDYHYALKRRLKALAGHLQIEPYISLDLQPVMERDLAHRAGLGWFGKNSMIISRQHGSYFIIGSLLLPQKLSLPPAEVVTDFCGTCVACVEACPTDAIDPVTRTLKPAQCISTFTIELMKPADPPAGFEKSRGEFFGCDICQDVCPWNKKPLERTTPELKLADRYAFLKDLFYGGKIAETLDKASTRGWDKMLVRTVFDRPGKRGWLKNLKPFRSSRNDL